LGNAPIQPENEAFQVSHKAVHVGHESLEQLKETLKLGKQAANLFNEPFRTRLAGSTASLERIESLRQQHPPIPGE
jgi:hypothetical protein